jgi:hypothetical protein
VPIPDSGECDDEWPNSLYQKMVVYALQYCMRPSDDTARIISNEVLADVNAVMDSIKSDMAAVLADECDRRGGEWTTTYQTLTNENNEIVPVHNKLMDFYNNTNAHLGWGLCYEP